jgi:GDP-4-dehydro-6-deoxy-D-mannose reductase
MRVLVTGGSGFVGGHLLRELTEHGHEVISWGLGGAETDSTVQVDLRDAQALVERDLQGLDAVIHLAGLAQVSNSFEQPAEYVSTNTGMQINLMEALLHQGSHARVLVVSTGGVYRSGPDVITETSPTEPSNPYVVSKLTQELLASYYAQRGLEVIIARPFNHIGPGQQRGYLVSDLAGQIAALERVGGGTVSVGNLESERDYTDVRDVVAAYRCLITDGRSGEIYNVCSGVSRTGAELLERFTALASEPISSTAETGLKRPIDANQVRASNLKIQSDTGWHPTIAIAATLADTLTDWRSRTGA